MKLLYYFSQYKSKKGGATMQGMGLSVNELVEIVKKIDLQTFSEIVELCASYEQEE